MYAKNWGGENHNKAAQNEARHIRVHYEYSSASYTIYIYFSTFTLTCPLPSIRIVKVYRHTYSRKNRVLTKVGEHVSVVLRTDARGKEN